MDPNKRYESDACFRMVVDHMVDILSRGVMMPSDLRDAQHLAATMHSHTTGARVGFLAVPQTFTTSQLAEPAKTERNLYQERLDAMYRAADEEKTRVDLGLPPRTAGLAGIISHEDEG